jgi:NAD(P)-dependent dehydrogenase (short-subunit alcohol dehydrogenase family)
MERLEGKVAVITGGNSGIGLATTQLFVSEGAYVFITGRHQSELDVAVKQIGNGKNNNNNITGIHGDISNLADLDRLYAAVKEQTGHIDILFANAGVSELAPLGGITEAHFDKLFGINVKGLLFTVQKALPLFQGDGGGSIILNASNAASKGIEASTVYSATKAAIRSFARTWTAELKHRKIRVNAISPGPIDTPIFNGLAQSEEQIEQFKTSIVSAVPMGRMGSPDEVAKAVLFLASDDSSYVTGIELFVDGGMAQI